MHAVVTTVSIGESAGPAEEVLREQVVPRISSVPGFVAGYWVRLAEDRGASVVVFESEDAANAAREQIQPPPGVTIESAEVGEVVANA
jgi:heme-degrading monooxygenase HmoA